MLLKKIMEHALSRILQYLQKKFLSKFIPNESLNKFKHLIQTFFPATI